MLKWYYSKPPRHTTFVYFNPYCNTFFAHLNYESWPKELNEYMFWAKESNCNVEIYNPRTNCLCMNFFDNQPYYRSTLKDQFNDIIDIENESDKDLIQWYKDLLNQ